MKPYLSIFRIRFVMQLQYRAAAIAGLATQIVFGWIIVMVYEAFYAASDTIHPISFEQVVTYIWLGQALLGNLPWGCDSKIQGAIREGTIAYELCRPIDVYNAWLAYALSWRMARTLLRAIPMFLIATTLFGMKWPQTIDAAVMFFLAMPGAFLLSGAITVLMNTTLLWTLEGRGVYMLVSALLIFSGQEIPLPLMPDWLRATSEMLPFRGIVDTPFRMYLGDIRPHAALPYFIHQWVWIAVLVFAGRRMLRAGRRKVVIQGG